MVARQARATPWPATGDYENGGTLSVPWNKDRKALCYLTNHGQERIMET